MIHTTIDHTTRQPVTRKGSLSPERYEQLMAALEEAEDTAAFDAAMEEEGPNIPWEQVKTDLGWT